MPRIAVEGRIVSEGWRTILFLLMRILAAHVREEEIIELLHSLRILSLVGCEL